MTLTADALARVHAAAFTMQRPWTAAEFENILAMPGLILSGDAWSFVVGRVTADEAELLTIATHPEKQGQGRADQGLADFLKSAQTQGATRVFLEVAEDNAPANQLYFKHGFAEIGRRPKYYARPDGSKVSAILMQKRL